MDNKQKFEGILDDCTQLVNSGIWVGYPSMLDAMQSAYDLALQESEAAIENLAGRIVELENEWISVNDRLPEMFVPVLCNLKQGGFAVGNLCRNNDMWNIGFGEPFRINYVTHWQNLPQPPQ